MATMTLEYPTELSMALGKRQNDVASEIKLMAALKLYETGRISSGLASQLAGIPRVEFLMACGNYGITIFQQTEDEVALDKENAIHACRC